MNLRLPKKDSAVYRAIVTLGQVLVGGVVLYYTKPEFKVAIQACYDDLVYWIPASITASALIWNFLRRGVRNY